MIRNTSDGNLITRDYLDSILFEQRLINADVPSTEFELFGETFSTPIMTPAFSHIKAYAPGRENGLVEYSRAAKAIGAVNFIGMIENEGFAEVIGANKKTIRIVKPYADRPKIFDQLAYAQEKGAFAVGVDIDHAFSRKNGSHDICMGEEMEPQSFEMLKECIDACSVPFILKGVLSVKDAALAAQAGVDAIIVSHHHARLAYVIPPLMILPDIVKELENTGIRIFVDCSIDTGYDAFKALALGADAVCVGRALLPDLQENGVEGARTCLQRMTDELATAMAFTGAKSLDQISASVLWNKDTGRRLIER